MPLTIRVNDAPAYTHGREAIRMQLSRVRPGVSVLPLSSSRRDRIGSHTCYLVCRFGRQDALARHKKAEHESPTQPTQTSKRTTTESTKPSPVKRRRERRPSTPEHEPVTMEKYKLAKAKLRYILRENEMLTDEWQSTQKKLKRLQTERKVLLEALMEASGNSQGLSPDEGVSDDDEEMVDIGSDDDIDENDETGSVA